MRDLTDTLNSRPHPENDSCAIRGCKPVAVPAPEAPASSPEKVASGVPSLEAEKGAGAANLAAMEAQGERCPDCEANLRDWKLIAQELGCEPIREDMCKVIRKLRAELRKEEVMPTATRSTRTTTDTRPSGEVAGGPLGFCKDKYHFGSHPKTDSCVDWLSEAGGPTESPWHEIAEKWHEANWFKSSSPVKLHERLIELAVEATLDAYTIRWAGRERRDPAIAKRMSELLERQKGAK
jgi:hypothetical protein